MLFVKLQFDGLHCGLGWVTWLNFQGIWFGIVSIKRTFKFDGEDVVIQNYGKQLNYNYKLTSTVPKFEARSNIVDFQEVN